MNKKGGIIANIFIILVAIAGIVLYLIEGFGDIVNLIMFILSCLMIVICTIDIIIEIKKNKNDNK